MVRKLQKKPLVSIIIATYRRKESLYKSIASAINQTYTNLEVIVVDDNANDEWNKSVENTIKSFNLETIKYIKNNVNLGSAQTRNRGITASKGRYITFLDDDDIYLPNKVENQINHMITQNSDFCLTDLELLSENNKLIEKRSRYFIKSTQKEDLLRYHLMYHLTGTDTLMFKREYLLNIGMFTPIDVGDEFYLMHKAILGEGRFSYLPVCDVKAYVHSSEGGLSSGQSKIKGENDLYEFKKQYFNYLDKKSIKYINMRHYAVLAFAEIRRKNYFLFFNYAVKSFFHSPSSCLLLLINR